MRLAILLVITLMTAGCAEFSKRKVGEDGLYRFAQHPIAVEAPDRCLLDLFVHESDNAVDFVTSRGYWQQAGQYAVQVFPIPASISDPESFVTAAGKLFVRYMVEDRESLGLRLRVVDKGATEVNGQPVYRAVSVDEGKGVFIATAVLHEQRITIASLVYPLESGQDHESAVPEACYERFTASVREVP